MSSSDKMHAYTEAPISDSPMSADVIDFFLAIRGTSLFSLFPEPEVTELLIRNSHIESYTAGDPIPAIGPARELCIVGNGTVGLFRRRERDRRAGDAKSGRSIELDTFLKEKEQWQHVWTADTNCEVLRINGDAFRSLLNQHPQVHHYLKLVALHPELQKLKNDLRLFGFTMEEIIRSFSAIKMTTRAEESPSTAPRLVIVHTGSILMGTVVRGMPRIVGRLLTGNYAYLKFDDPALRLQVSADFSFWSISPEEWATLVPSKKAEDFCVFSDYASSRIQRLLVPEPESLDVNLPSEMASVDDGLTIEDFSVTDEALKRIWKKKAVNVRQHDQMDCGAACLSMITRFYGKRLDLPSCRSLVQVTRDGASVASIQHAAEQIGMSAMGVHSKYKGLKNIRVPFVALMAYHFVVVFKASEDEVVFSCPVRGVVRCSPDEFRLEYSGNILALKPTPKFAELSESKSSYLKYLNIFRGHEADMARVLLMTMVLFIFGLAQPVLYQFAFDAALAEGKSGVLTTAIACMFGAAFLSIAMNFTRDFLVNHMTSRIDAKFAALFLRYLYKLPLSYFAIRRVGDVTSRMGEMVKIRDFFTSRPISVLLNLLSLGFFSFFVGMYSGQILLLALLQVALLTGVILFFVPRLTSLSRLAFAVGAKSSSMLYEHIRSLETLKSMGGLIAARWRWEAVGVESMAISSRLGQMHSNMSAVSGFLSNIFSGLVTLMAFQIFLKSNFTLGQAIAIISLVSQVVGPAVSLVSEWHSLSEFGNSLGRVDDVFTARPEEEGTLVVENLTELAGDIEFRKIGFRYGNESSPAVLTNINLRINPGETVALVGRSGSGKTTLAYLVNLLYSPTEGEVFIDGRPATDYPRGWLRQQIGFVLQETSLFNGTVLENIAMGDPLPSFERVVEAARLANAHEFISKLKFGYATKLGEGGSGLSGGQRQRLGIANSLYRNPSILIMDEATSALDSISETLIVNNVKARSGTTILIAHRLHTIMHADRIVVVERGRIVEQGRHDQLLARQGLYYELFRRQIQG